MAKLMNVENERSDSIDASTIEDAVRIIQVEKLQCAMNPPKIRKASGPSGGYSRNVQGQWEKVSEILDKHLMINIFKDLSYRTGGR